VKPIIEKQSIEVDLTHWCEKKEGVVNVKIVNSGNVEVPNYKVLLELDKERIVSINNGPYNKIKTQEVELSAVSKVLFPEASEMSEREISFGTTKVSIPNCSAKLLEKKANKTVATNVPTEPIINNDVLGEQIVRPSVTEMLEQERNSIEIKQAQKQLKYSAFYVVLAVILLIARIWYQLKRGSVPRNKV
jgi:hypothetical protein